MKKRIFSLLIVIVVGSFLIGCGHEHTWKDATCTEPKICLECNETEGEPAGHLWKNATCTEPRICGICGATEGSALGHSWVSATCTEPEYCSVCNETRGEALGHSITEWKTVKEATCTEEGTQNGICTVCGETFEKSTEAKGHKAGEWKITKKATLLKDGKKAKICKVCGKKVKTKTYKLSDKERSVLYKDSCKTYSYNTIARDPDKYKYKYAKFTGKVVQVMEDGDEYTLRVNVTKTRWGYDDTILVLYTRKDKESRLLEDDIITLYGILGGTYTYESIMGASITVPLMYAEYVTLH